jgi:O-antigen/teichoic acid export membrane protein
MSTSRLIKNTGFLSLANALQPVLSYFLIVAVSRVWGEKGLGEYSTIFAYIGLFQVVSAFGLKTLLPREVARDPKAGRKLVLHGTAIVIPFAILSMVVMSGWIMLMGFQPSIIRAGVILSFSLLPASLIECFEGVVIGYQRIQWIAMVYTVENIFKVIVSLILIRLGFGLEPIVWVFTASKALSLSLYVGVLRRLLPRSEESGFDWAFYRRFVRLAFPFVLITFCVMMYWNVDKILLPKLTDMVSTGVYNAAYKFFWLVMLIISSFVTSLFPILSESYHSDPVKFERVCFKAIRYFAIATFPCAMGLFFLSKPIVSLIYGAKYHDAVAVLNVLCWALIPYGISEILAYSLIASNYQKIDLFINAAGMAVMACLNWVFIHWLGFLGAAWAILATSCLYLATLIPFVAGRALKTRPEWFIRDLFKTTTSAVLSIILWAVLVRVHWALGAAVGLCSYPIFILSLRVVQSDDVTLFYRALKKLRTYLPGSSGSQNF